VDRCTPAVDGILLTRVELHACTSPMPSARLVVGQASGGDEATGIEARR